MQHLEYCQQLSTLPPKPASFTSSLGRKASPILLLQLFPSDTPSTYKSISQLYHQLLALLPYCQFALNFLRNLRHTFSMVMSSQQPQPRASENPKVLGGCSPCAFLNHSIPFATTECYRPNWRQILSALLWIWCSQQEQN